ncbi:HTH-type transcriptional activator CmpR [mine drainage metagenome]|uniref:HTH-type transcriptional activator CmpR n=1 Tax=mine drainage metagenome TaxID=410659 RepID=A0A1J5SSR3_9ZZZZ
MSVSLKQIRAFVTVAQAGSFTAAASRLHLTQSAVSVLISELEAEFGLRLFDRTTRLVQLADAGRDFYPVAEKILADLHNALSSSKELVAKKRGRVSVASTPLMASILLPKAIGEYTAIYPGISVILQDTLAGLIQQKVRDGTADFGIGTFEKAGRELVAEPFMADTLVLACPAGHPLAAKASVAWRTLAGHPFISLSRDNSVGQLIRNCLADAGVEVHSAYEVSYLTTVIGMVDAGLGVAVLPSYASPITRSYDIQIRKLVKPAIRREMSFITRQGRTLSPAAESLKAFLKSYVKTYQ